VFYSTGGGRPSPSTARSGATYSRNVEGKETAFLIEKKHWTVFLSNDKLLSK
jgi:hypothetical protein